MRCSVLLGGLDQSISILLLPRSHTMRSYIRGGCELDVLFGDFDGLRIMGLRVSRTFDFSPLYGPEAMIWAYIRDGSHRILSLKVRHEMIMCCDSRS